MDSRIRRIIDETVARANLPTAEAREDLRRELEAHFEEGRADAFGSPRAIAARLRRVHREPATTHRTGGGMLHDIRFGLRMLFRAPAFSAMAILCLTIGIGANAAVFGWIEGILLRPFPLVQGQDRLYALTGTDRASGERTDLSWPDLLDLARASTLADAFIGEKITGSTLSIGDRAQRVTGGMVSANYFDAVGVRPALGRGFLPGEDAGRGAHPVTVISYQLWQDRFHGDPAVIGKTQVLAGLPHTIVGVAPQGFYGTFVGYAFQFWVPASMQPQFDSGVSKLEDRNARWVEPFVRLKPGVSLARAQTELSAIASRLEREYPQTNRGRGVRLYPLWQTPFNNAGALLPTLMIALVVVVAVLVIACANVGNLLLVRALARQQEMTIRLSIGATRMRLVRQLLTEGLVLSLPAAAGAIGVAWVLRNALAVITPPRGGVLLQLPGQLDWRVLAASAAVCLFATLLFALVPAAMASSIDMAASLKAHGNSIFGTRGRARVRSALVLVQISLSFVLIVGAGLLVKSLIAVRHADPGFAADSVVTTSVDLFPSGYTPQRAEVAQEAILDRVRALGGVDSAAWSRMTPFSYRSYPSATLAVDGYEAPPDQQPSAEYNVVGPGYFEAMGIPIVQGRGFLRTDDDRAAGVAIVDETMAARYWKQADPLGRRLVLDGLPVRVVGVARAVKYGSLFETARPFFYRPLRQLPAPAAALHIRTRAGAGTLAPQIIAIVRAVAGDVVPGEVITMREQVDRTTASQRIAVTILAGFGGLALLLAAIGLYGVMASSVAQGRRELALRLALGASREALLQRVVSRGLALASAGIAAGLAAALGLTRLLGYLLYGVNPRDPAVFGAAIAVLAATAIIACIAPAVRALRTEPAVVLRS